MLSIYAAGKVHEGLVGVSASPSFAAPTFLALLSEKAVASDDGTTLAEKEVAYGGYERTPLAKAVWDAPDGLGAILNAQVVKLPTRTSGAAQVVAWAVCDAASGGNVIFFGDVVAFMVDAADPEPAIGVGLLRHAFG